MMLRNPASASVATPLLGALSPEDGPFTTADTPPGFEGDVLRSRPFSSSSSSNTTSTIILPPSVSSTKSSTTASLIPSYQEGGQITARTNRTTSATDRFDDVIDSASGPTNSLRANGSFIYADSPRSPRSSWGGPQAFDEITNSMSSSAGIGGGGGGGGGGGDSRDPRSSLPFAGAPLGRADSRTHLLNGVVERVYAIRWFVLTIFCVNTLVNCILWISFSSIVDAVSHRYSVSTTQVNLLSMAYFVSTLVFMFPATWFVERYGLRIGILCPVGLQVLGSWIRFAGAGQWGEPGTVSDPSHYYALLFGQIVCGIAQPFFICVPPKLANTWFGTKERTIATSIATMSNMSGVIFGLNTSHFVAGDGHNLPLLLLIQGVLTTACGFLFLIFFRNRPPTPPSKSADRSNPPPILQALVQLLRNPQFLLLGLFFGVGVGLINSFLALLTQLVEAEHYSSEDSSTMGSLVIACGVVGATIMSIIADRTHAYKVLILVGAGGSTLFLMIFALVLAPDRFPYLVLLCGVTGAMSLSLLPVCIETGCEVAFPVPEQLIAGFMLAVGQIFGIIFTVSVGSLGFKGPAARWFFVGGGASIFVLALFFKGQYRRFTLDAEKVSNSQDNDIRRPLLT